jgi:hypothetical protein
MKIDKLKELEIKLLKYGFKKFNDIFSIDYGLKKGDIIFQILIRKRDNILLIGIRQPYNNIILSKNYDLTKITDIDFIQLISKINTFKTLLFDLFCDS